MNRIQKTIVGVLLAASSSVAMAALPAVPTPQPVSITASGAPASSTNGGLLVAVWDLATNSSLVQYLGLNYTDVNITDMSAPGAYLNFGILDKFTSTFSDAIGSGQTARLQYMVVAAAPGTSKGVRATGSAGWTDELTLNGDPVGLGFAASNVNTWITEVLNLTPAGTDSCGRVNSCVVVNQATDARIWGTNITTGSSLGGTIPSNASYSGAVGSTLEFYQTTISGGAVSVLGAGSANTWLLSSAGQLTFGNETAPIPLPAAAWLLLSGLAGLGAIGRRRQKA